MKIRPILLGLTFLCAALITVGAATGSAPGAAPGAAPGELGTARGELTDALAKLNIDDTQKRDIATLLKDKRTATKPLVDELIAARTALQDAIQADAYDETAIRAAYQRVSDAQLELTLVRAQTVHDVRGFLTPEQRASAKELRGQFRERLLGRIATLRDLVNLWIDRHATT